MFLIFYINYNKSHQELLKDREVKNFVSIDLIDSCHKSQIIQANGLKRTRHVGHICLDNATITKSCFPLAFSSFKQALIISSTWKRIFNYRLLANTDSQPSIQISSQLHKACAPVTNSAKVSKIQFLSDQTHSLALNKNGRSM